MKIIDDHEVTLTEKITRFICGMILGVVVGVYLIYRLNLSSATAISVVALVSVFGCAILAMLYGDRFWYWIFGGGR